MSVCHHTLFAFLSAIHSNVQNCSFLYINCIRIIYAHSMFFFSMRFLYLFWKCYNCNLYHHTLNIWVYSFCLIIVLCCEFIYFIIFAKVPKKNATIFFLKCLLKCLIWLTSSHLPDHEYICLSNIMWNVWVHGWLALIWFSILPNIVKFWFMSKSNASPFLTVKLTTLGQCLASKQDWLIYVYQIVYSYTFIHYA